jgi:hypothetical protein
VSASLNPPIKSEKSCDYSLPEPLVLTAWKSHSVELLSVEVPLRIKTVELPRCGLRQIGTNIVENDAAGTIAQVDEAHYNAMAGVICVLVI